MRFLLERTGAIEPKRLEEEAYTRISLAFKARNIKYMSFYFATNLYEKEFYLSSQQI